jgi:SAM-dependent MidA family methyltransferase
VATLLDRLWSAAGEPDRWMFVDLGAGTGSLARSVIAAGPRCVDALEVHLIERSASQRADYVALCAWGADRGVSVAVHADGEEFDSRSVHGLVLGNEVLDNLPWRILRTDEAGTAEVWVGADRSMAWRPCDPVDVPPGARSQPFPLQTQAHDLVAAWVDRVASGAVVFIDYGAVSTEELSQRSGWLRTYREQQVGTDPLADIGWRDVTSDIAFDQLPGGAGLQTQAEALESWGMFDLVAKARIDVERLAAVGNLEWVAARSALSEAEALADPAGLGGFLVASWGAGEANG